MSGRATRAHALVALATLTLTGCRKTDASVARESPVADASIARDAAAAGSAAFEDASSARDASTAPGTREPPPRMGIGGSTRASIACGTQRCDATKDESCVLSSGSWTCVGAVDTAHAALWFPCDDATDCRVPGRQLDPGATDRFTCCADPWRPDSTMCNYRDGVDTEPCSFEMCSNEPGAAACPKGQACADGRCRPSLPVRATCAKGARCPEEAPVCRWQSDVGSCVAQSEARSLREASLARPDATDLASVLACTKKSDCGVGQVCCLAVSSWVPDPAEPALARLTECRLACDPRAVQDVCATDADCPPFFATGANGGLRPRRCKRGPPRPAHPAWMGSCE